MKRFGSTAVLVALATVAGASVAMAQLPGIPLGVVPTGTGLMVAADYAQPEGGADAWGLSGGVGLGRFGALAAVGNLDGGGNSATTYGGLVGMRLIGGGLNPLAIGIEAGAGTMSVGGVSVTRVPIGATIAFNPPLFPIKPWGVVYYQTGDNVSEETRISIGANFNFLLGFGIHGGYDWGDSGYTWGVGAHFNFRVPTM